MVFNLTHSQVILRYKENGSSYSYSNHATNICVTSIFLNVNCRYLVILFNEIKVSAMLYIE
jgi:hypothetical protein